jgi:undecaprenyl-diphosphatase
MNIFTAAFLGLVQGITEFLPVSSSAHLVFFQHILPGFSQTGVLFDILLHVATTLAVIFYFRKTLFDLTFREIVLLGVGTIPAAVVGILFRKQLEALFSSVFWAGITLAISGVLNILVDRAKTTRERVTLVDSVLIGIAQAIAIIPGISRSGSTIFTGVALGIDRKKVAQYSFLLSIPAILGASAVEVLSHGFDTQGSLGAYILGAVVAGVTAYFSINFLLNTLSTKKYRYFGYYAIVVGLFAAFFIK